MRGGRGAILHAVIEAQFNGDWDSIATFDLQEDYELMYDMDEATEIEIVRGWRYMTLTLVRSDTSVRKAVRAAAQLQPANAVMYRRRKRTREWTTTSAR